MKSYTKPKHEIKRDYWQQQISNWRSSGLSQNEYCRRNAIALTTFCYWKTKRNKEETAQPTFFPLTLPESSSGASEAGLKLLVGSRQFQILLKEDFSPTALKKLITVLEQL
jgi:hypothetical protein